MTDNVILLRDFKRKEEIEAADARFTKRIADLDTAPSEMPFAVWPDFSLGPEKDPS